jgi:hypothetical protein
MTYKIPDRPGDWIYHYLDEHYGLRFKRESDDVQLYLMNHWPINDKNHPLELPGIVVSHYLENGRILLILKDIAGEIRHIRHSPTTGKWEAV